MPVRGNVPSDPRTRYAIWVTCDDCGDVPVAGEHCTLIRRQATVTLAYLCGGCRRRAVVAVPEPELTGLLAKGFTITDSRMPREVTEPRPECAPITWDDVLAAHELLAETDFVVARLR